MNKAIFYELFLKEFDDLEKEYDDLKEKLRRGRNVRVIAMQMAELEVRINETERIFQKLKPWFL